MISFLPILLMGILFGLAMDYELFLVSRIREEYVHGDSAKAAISDGFAASARVVVAAAIIMFSVFAAFVPEGEGPIKTIAFGLAVGVFVDAFIVRMTFVPAVLARAGPVGVVAAPLARSDRCRRSTSRARGWRTSWRCGTGRSPTTIASCSRTVCGLPAPITSSRWPSGRARCSWSRARSSSGKSALLLTLAGRMKLRARAGQDRRTRAAAAEPRPSADGRP